MIFQSITRFVAQKSLWLVAVITIGLSSMAFGAVPKILHYQGHLTNAAGVPVDCPDALTCEAQYNVTFRLYDSAQGGTMLWEEAFQAVPIRKGAFNVLLGSTHPIDAGTLDLDAVYLGLTINDTDELQPRQQFVSAAYAIRAEYAQDAAALGGKAASDYVGTDDIAGLCITDEEMTTLLTEKNYCTECYSDGDVAIYLTDKGFAPGPGYTDEQVQAYLTANGYVSGAHTVDTDTQLSSDAVLQMVAAGGYVSGAHTVDTVLTEKQVDDFTDNNGYASQALLDAVVPGQWTVTENHIQSNNAPNVVVTNEGKVGVGTQTPATRLDVAGGVKLGNAEDCNADLAGTLRWTGSAFEGCDGTKWASLGGGGSTPAGTIMGWPADVAPEGFLECNGASVAKADFPKLFAAIGTSYGSIDSASFNLPDFRGEFLRGWSHASGKDPNAGGRSDRGDGTSGDQVGTKQSNEIKSHNHKIGRWVGGSPGYQYPFPDPNQDNALLDDGGPNSNVQATGGSESRPRNINVMWVIKN